MNSCAACRQGKRRCDRARPQCSSCARIGRPCIYGGSALSVSPRVAEYESISQHASLDVTTQLAPDSSHASSPLPGPLTNFDPFQSDALRKPTIDVAVATEVFKHLGSLDRVRQITTTYFGTIHKRLPTISLSRFQDRFPSLGPTSPASFTALCLCMRLLQQSPVTNGDSMQSSLYLTGKSIVSLLEGTGYSDLDAVHCRVMIAFYELGHGIYPAASVSIAGSAKLACAIGLHKDIEYDAQCEKKLLLEERRRVWWAVVTLDRGDSHFSTRDLSSSSSIPIDDDLWFQNVRSTLHPEHIHVNIVLNEAQIIPMDEPHRLSTPSSATVGIFARECQVTHLTGMVIRHVCEPTLDVNFQLEEALQLERTLMAFMPLLLEDGIMFGKYCVALGICSSALYTLNDALVRRGQRDELEARKTLEDLSTQIFGFTRRLFGDVNRIDYSQLSPYVPYCVYQSAVVQTQLWRDRRDEVYMERSTWLKTLLELFNRRWRTAGKYLTALDREELSLVLHAVR